MGRRGCQGCQRAFLQAWRGEACRQGTQQKRQPSSHNIPAQAYPYYGSIFSLMAAFLATGAAFLYTK